MSIIEVLISKYIPVYPISLTSKITIDYQIIYILSSEIQVQTHDEKSEKNERRVPIFILEAPILKITFRYKCPDLNSPCSQLSIVT